MRQSRGGDIGRLMNLQMRMNRIPKFSKHYAKFVRKAQPGHTWLLWKDLIGSVTVSRIVLEYYACRTAGLISYRKALGFHQPSPCYYSVG